MLRRKIVILFVILTMLSACSDNMSGNSNRTDTFSNKKSDISLLTEHVSSDLYKELPVKYMNDIFDIAINQDNDILIADKNVVQIFDYNGILKKNISGDFTDCTRIAADNSDIWFWENKQKALFHLDSEGKLIEKKQIPLNNVEKMLYLDATLFILGSDENGNKNIYKYNKNKDLKKAPLENVVNMCSYMHEDLIIITQQENMDAEIVIYNYQTDKIVSKTKSAYIAFNDLFFNNEDNKIYFTEGSKLISLTVDGNRKKILMDLTNKGTILQKILVQNNAILLLDVKNTRICIVDLNTLENTFKPEDKIRIVTFDNLFGTGDIANNVMQKTRDKYLNASFEFEYLERSIYYDRLITRIMSKDKTFDVFYLGSQYSPYFIKNNVMYDLGEYDFVTERFKDCFDNIQNLCSYKNKIFAIPLGISLNIFLFNNELSDKIGIKRPGFGWNWNDFCELAKETRNNKTIYDAFMIDCKRDFFPVLLETYFCDNIDLMENKANLKCNDFKTILQIYKKLYTENLISENNIPVTHSDNTLLYLSSFFSDDLKNSSIISLPTFSKYNIDIKYLCVNGLSDKKEISAYFISNYLNKDVYNKNIYVNPVFKDVKIYKNSLSIKENYELYQNILNNSVTRQYNTELFTFIANTTKDYLNDKLSVDEAISIMQKKADMMLNE